jgi:hypothetical protein
MAVAYTRNQMCFPVLESTFGTAVTPVGADACLITSLSTQASQGEIPRPDKTGSLGEIAGIPGRRSATWQASMSLAGNGAAGVAPDCDVFLQLIFGKAVAIAAATSATYALDDNQYSGSIWHYNDPSTVCQYVALGSVCNSLRVALGGDVPTLDFSGPALWVLDTDQLADVATDSIAKGGLSAWTARPTPSVNGKAPAGFTGVITLDGQAYGTLRSATINLSVEKELPMDTFNSYYAAAPAAGMRSVSVDFSIYDDDSANLKALKQKAAKAAYTVVDLVFAVGTVAGNIWTWTLKNVKLPIPSVDYGSNRRSLTFSGCRAHDTSIGSKDALALVIT